LKLTAAGESRLRITVAPRRGAWIETHFSPVVMVKNSVAPRRGAWIETKQSGQ